MDGLITPPDLAKIKIVQKMIKGGMLGLDLGCGAGHSFPALSKMDDVVGLDASKRALGIAKKRTKKYALILGDAQKLPFRDACFDVLIAKDVLEHMTNDLHVISEINRVSKLGAKLIVYVPYTFDTLNLSIEYLLKNCLGYSIDKFVGHLRRYDCFDITNKLQKGFLISHTTYFTHFFSSTVAVLCVIGYRSFNHIKPIKEGNFVKAVSNVVKLLCLVEYKIMKKLPGAGLFIVAKRRY